MSTCYHARMFDARRIAGLGAIGAMASGARAQDGVGERVGLWGLFWQSFDLFSVLLILGSMVAVGLIVRGVMDVRRGVMLSPRSLARLEELADAGRFGEMVEFARKDGSIVSRVLFEASRASDASGMRELAEGAAGEECARWYRRVEPLNLIGNLAPLVGLAGTVWGMILAFQGLGAAGGEARAGVLSLGISKALFHTLLGLLLATPCLLAYGLLRARVDGLCNEAMVVAGRLLDRLIAERGARPEAPVMRAGVVA